jgi:hypothetical protein
MLPQPTVHAPVFALLEPIDSIRTRSLNWKVLSKLA